MMSGSFIEEIGKETLQFVENHKMAPVTAVAKTATIKIYFQLVLP